MTVFSTTNNFGLKVHANHRHSHVIVWVKVQKRPWAGAVNCRSQWWCHYDCFVIWIWCACWKCILKFIHVPRDHYFCHTLSMLEGKFGKTLITTGETLKNITPLLSYIVLILIHGYTYISFPLWLNKHHRGASNKNKKARKKSSYSITLQLKGRRETDKNQ